MSANNFDDGEGGGRRGDWAKEREEEEDNVNCGDNVLILM